MKRSRPAGRHLEIATALDFLEQRLAGERLRRVEEHLGWPCPQCRERVRALGALHELMRRDRAPEVPEWLHRRAVEVFAPVERPAEAPPLEARLARLLFDSAATPVPVAVRRAVGESRRLRFALGAGVLELECEAESGGAVTLRGRLAVEDPALHRIEIEAGAERLTAWPDASGAFALERVPRGRARITVSGPAASWRFRSLRLEA